VRECYLQSRLGGKAADPTLEHRIIVSSIVDFFTARPGWKTLTESKKVSSAPGFDISLGACIIGLNLVGPRSALSHQPQPRQILNGFKFFSQRNCGGIRIPAYGSSEFISSHQEHILVLGSSSYQVFRISRLESVLSSFLRWSYFNSRSFLSFHLIFNDMLSYFPLFLFLTSSIASLVQPASSAGSAGCGNALPNKQTAGGQSHKVQSKTSTGIGRTYLLYIPLNYDVNTPVPLIFSFHGHGKNSSEQEGLSQFSNADSNYNPIGFAVYPGY
jgi:hypothetical protein